MFDNKSSDGEDGREQLLVCGLGSVKPVCVTIYLFAQGIWMSSIQVPHCLAQARLKQCASHAHGEAVEQLGNVERGNVQSRQGKRVVGICWSHLLVLIFEAPHLQVFKKPKTVLWAVHQGLQLIERYIQRLAHIIPEHTNGASLNVGQPSPFVTLHPARKLQSEKA